MYKQRGRYKMDYNRLAELTDKVFSMIATEEEREEYTAWLKGNEDNDNK